MVQQTQRAMIISVQERIDEGSFKRVGPKRCTPAFSGTGDSTVPVIITKMILTPGSSRKDHRSDRGVYTPHAWGSTLYELLILKPKTSKFSIIY